MSLRKSPTMTPARLEPHRRNARKFTGTRTTRGMAQPRLYGLGRGPRSRFYHDFMMLLTETPPNELARTAREILTLKDSDFRLFKGLLRMIYPADFELAMEVRPAYPLRKFPEKRFATSKARM